MKQLVETVGLDIEVDETEFDIDGCNADIVGVDARTERKDIIENEMSEFVKEKDIEYQRVNGENYICITELAKLGGRV